MINQKKLASRLGLNDHVRAKVIERIDDNDWIFSVEGCLVRMTNLSKKGLQEGQIVTLRLKSKNPLELSLNI